MDRLKKIGFVKILILLVAVIAAVFIVIQITSSGGSKVLEGDAVPEMLANTSFVYDELETGEGDALYTLEFTNGGYALYRDSGVGIVSKGVLEVSSDKTLKFVNQNETFTGSYKGSAFEEVSVSIDWQDSTMNMTPATETTEYVYLSYLGTYEGIFGDLDAVLILERWFEYYLYYNDTLYRGTYEIHSDKTIEFTPYEGDGFSGTLDYPTDGEFDLRSVTMNIDASLGGNSVSGDFSLADAQSSYEAAHAMGAYTISVYKEDVFVIHGVDGFVKAMGTLRMENNTGAATYFPRKITDEIEIENNYVVEFTYDGSTMSFPETIPLLPRSGNIDDETGFGSYWNAGTKLEFILNSGSDVSLSDGIIFTDELIDGAVAGGNFPDNGSMLDQCMPSKGTAKPLVLLIDFPDYHRPRHVDAKGIEDELFSMDNEDSLTSYYYRSSFGNLVIDGDVLDWYRADLNRDDYASDTELMAEAINYYIEQGLDLSEYDADGDGEIASLFVLWAGTLSGEGGTWDTAYRSTWRDSPADWNTDVKAYIFVPGSTVWSMVPPLACNTNSLIHETGHLLGLNDYYSYDTNPRNGSGAYTGGALEGGLSGMDMMEANIGEHNIYSKWLLGWAEPTVIEYDEISTLDGQIYEIRASSIAGDALFIKLDDTDSLHSELFVIESVAPVGNAAEYTRLSQPVVRIMHIDATVAADDSIGGWRGFGFEYDNSYTSTKFISTIEADGKDEFLNFVPANKAVKESYSEDDYFIAGDVITPNTYPNTNAYDSHGNASISTGIGIEIVEIKEDGTATIRLFYEEAKESLQLTDITPEERIVPYLSSEETFISADTTEIRFTYDSQLSEIGDLNTVMVYSNNEVVTGTSATIEGNQLVVSFEDGVQRDSSYTVVIPRGIISSADNENHLNNFSGIYGFVVEE